MGKPKARASTTGASKGKTTVTRRGSSTASRPSNIGRKRQLTQGRGGPPGQTQLASPLPGVRARALHQGRPARGRSREDSAASPSLQPPPQSAQRATSRQPPSLVMPNTRGAGPVRTTAASNTSPRAQHAARRGEAAHLQERQQEEQTGQEGLAALEEAAADAVEAGAEGDVAAAGSGLTQRGEQGAAVEADPTGTGREAHSPAAVRAAASDDDSTSPAAGPTAPPADKVVAAEEAHVEHGSADSPAPLVAVSPSPLGEVEIAAVAAEAARQPEQPLNEPFAPTAAESAGMSTAAAAVNMRECGQAADGIEGPVIGVASGIAQARKKVKLRAQPTPRRPGAGLGPGVPGPLLGWLPQGQSPPEQARLLSSAPQPAMGTGGRGNTEAADRAHRGTEQPSRMQQPPEGSPTTQQATHRETRSSTRGRGIVWGRPSGAGRATMATPWVPASQGLRSAQESARGGSAGVLPAIPRGGRGGRGGTRCRGVPLLGGEAAIVRSGTWRDRHDRPERTPMPVCVNGGEEGSENSQNGSEFIPSHSEASEDLVSLGDDENQHVSAQGRVRRTEQGGMPQPPNMPAGQDPAVPPPPSEKSPIDLAKDESFWHLASTWDIAPLQRADQPFLVRRLPPKILESYTLCLLAPLLRLGLKPDCVGAWTVLQFLPRLTHRPLPEPVDGNRRIKIETRLHHFRIGDLADLYRAAVIAYVDDITVVGPREEVFKAFDAIVEELVKRGLRCNVA
ncbi:unnamed protein product [Closterium sp. NIES-65]|nr:unnamed protein product [Closterium sp. NIES-65]